MFSCDWRDIFLLSHVHTFVKNMHHHHHYCNCCHLPVFHSLHVYFAGSWCWGEEENKCNCQRACNQLFFCECEQHPLLKTILKLPLAFNMHSYFHKNATTVREAVKYCIAHFFRHVPSCLPWPPWPSWPPLGCTWIQTSSSLTYSC